LISSSLEEGYAVFIVTDCSDTSTRDVRDAAWRIMEQSGAKLINWFGLGAELKRD
jgi:nicotinamidase-related amidase